MSDMLSRGDEILTMSDAIALSALLTNVHGNANLELYPADTDGSAVYDAKPLSGVMRNFTHEGGNFWFDEDGDVRDAYVWVSGTFEHWFKVSDLIAWDKAGRINYRER